MHIQESFFDVDFRFKLTPAEQGWLERPVEGEGGHQGLARRVQQWNAHGVLILTLQELDRCYRYAWAYGDGTWQQYFRTVLRAAERAGWAPPSELVKEVEARREEVQMRRW